MTIKMRLYTNPQKIQAHRNSKYKPTYAREESRVAN
jgi:hypothetical protein